MAINPGSYPFSGGVHHGSNDNLCSDDIFPLVIKKEGQEVGTYSPLNSPGTEIDLPDDHLEAELPIKIENKKISNNGANLTVTGTNAWAEGKNTQATGKFSHAEGESSEASSNAAHAEGSLTVSSAWATHAEGGGTKATASTAHAEGYRSEASGACSHAEGGTDAQMTYAPTKATGDYSHAEGTATTASGLRSHAEGESSTASGEIAHAEGLGTTASGNHAHSEGNQTSASGIDSHAEGLSTQATGVRCHAEGTRTVASGNQAHAEGYGGRATGETSHVEGSLCIAGATSAHAEGGATLALGKDSHAEGYGDSTRYNNPQDVAEGAYTYRLPDDVSMGGAQHIYIPSQKFTAKIMSSAGPTITVDEPAPADIPVGEEIILITDGATGQASHAEGYKTLAEGYCSHAEGYNTKADGPYAHAEGYNSVASGSYSHAEGSDTHATDAYAHAEGYNTTASETYAHAEGYSTTASGVESHAEGYFARATGGCSHAEGNETTASGLNCHAEGTQTVASGDQAHAEGLAAQASGQASHAGGIGTVAGVQAMTAIGKYNTGIAALFEVGFGSDSANRKDALRVDNSGNLWLVITNLTGEHLVKVTGLFAAFEISNGTRVGGWRFSDVEAALQAGLIPVIVNVPSGANPRAVYYYTSGTYDGVGFTYHFDLLDIDYPARYSLKYDDTLTREAQYIQVNYEVHTNNNTVTCDCTYDEILPFIDRPDKIRLKITYYNSSDVLDSYYNNALVWIGSNTPTLHFRFITHGTGGTGTAHIINHKADNTIEWG